MRKRTLFSILMSSLLIVGISNAQALEEETGFKYVKANYLFDSGRYDEAIQVYNQIVKEDPSYESVLIYRARAKYALGAYKGTKRDGLAFIELNGLTEDVCLVMGKAELGLGNPLVALSYFEYTLAMNPMNVDGLLFRGNAYFELEDDVAACTDWHKAKRLGSDRADQQTGLYCRRVAIPIEETQIEEPQYEETNSNTNSDDEVLGDDEVLSSDTNSDKVYDERTKPVEVITEDQVNSSTDSSQDVPINDSANTSEDDYIFESSDDFDEEFPEEDPIFDDEPLDIVVEIIEIDEDLDIKLYDGIGSRSVREVPDILILSDQAGQVVVDICVDRSGNVSEASLNRKKSTVGSAGLISLALRKSREFKFERSRDGEQCGKISFMIK